MSRNAQYPARPARPFFWSPAGLLCLWVLACGGLVRAEPPLGSNPLTGAEVVVVHDAAATHDLLAVPGVVRAMVDRGLTNLTATPTVAAGWLSLVTTQDTVGIKVFSQPGAYAGTRPAVVMAVVEGLLAAGIPPRQIIVWDKRAIDLRLAGFFELTTKYGIRVEGSIEAGWDPATNYESSVLGTPLWGDLEFGQTGDRVGRKSYVTKILSREVTKLINISPLMHHNQAGVSGNLYSLAMGGVDNTFRFERNSGALIRALPEIYAMGIVGDRVVLNIVDGLICQYEGEQRGLLHYSTVLNELRLSRDPLALDVLSLQEIERQRKLAGEPTPKTGAEIYENAALLEIGVAEERRIHVLTLP